MSDIASQIKKLTSELNSITGGKKNLLKAIFKQPPNGRTISNSIYGLKNEIEKLQEQLKKYQLEIQKFIQLDKFLENVHSLNKNDFDKLILDLMKKKNLSQGNINSIVKERMRRTKSKEKLNDIKLKLKKYSRNSANIYVKDLYENGQINSKEYITLLNFIPDNKVKKQANIRHFLKTTKAINNSNNPKKKIKKLNDPNTYNFNSMSSSRVDNSNNNSDLKQQKSITYNQNKNNTNKNVVQSFFRKKSSNVNNIMNSMAKKNNKNNK